VVKRFGGGGHFRARLRPWITVAIPDMCRNLHTRYPEGNSNVKIPAKINSNAGTAIEEILNFNWNDIPIDVKNSPDE